MSPRFFCGVLAGMVSMDCGAAGSPGWLDAEVYRASLVETARLWDGGLDGQSGLGAFRDDFNGFFRTDLDRMFRQIAPSADQTLISHCRAVYVNVEAYRAALDPVDRARFFMIAVKGADYLLEHGKDLTFGGLFWGLEADGSVPPSGNPGGPDALTKQAYGHVHAVFCLAHVFGITGDPDHLAGALDAWQVFRQHFRYPQTPGAYTPDRTRDFSLVLPENNFDYMLHYFEALLALYDVASGPVQIEVADELKEVGRFMTERLVHAPPGVPEEAYVCYWYGPDWELHPRAYNPNDYWAPSRFATAGHGIEFAWLLSRAAERGFPFKWLEVGERLLRFAIRHGVNPNTGGMLYDRLNLDGSAIPGPSAESLVWWPQAETARASMHYGALRDPIWVERFQTTEAFIRSRFVDPTYGGWYAGVTVSPAVLDAPAWSSVPDDGPKGSVWKVNYHVTMYYAEALRIAGLHDPELEWLMAFTSFERSALASRTAATADFDGDGRPNLLEFAMGENPRTAGVSPVRVSRTADGWTLTYPQVVVHSGITLWAEWSHDLINWIPVESTQVGWTDLVGREWIEAVVAGSGDGVFFRLLAATP